MKRILPLLLVAFAVSACQDQEPVSPERLLRPDGIRGAISDGDNAQYDPDGKKTSNDHFYFLPPVVKGAPSFSGTFNPRLRPEVTICRLGGSAPTAGYPGSAACQEELVAFTGAEVRMSATDEHYQVRWDTDSKPGESDTYYRVLVSVAGLELGYADVFVGSSPKTMRNLDAETLGLQDGRTLPIHFRIEHGAVGAAQAVESGEPFTCNNCAEATVNTGAGPASVVVPADENGHRKAAVEFRQGSLEGDYTIAINQKSVGPGGTCETGSFLEQVADYCYEFQAISANGVVGVVLPDTTPARVEVCLAPAFSLEHYRIYKYSGATEDFQALVGVPDQLISCPGAPLASTGVRVLDLALSGLQSLARPIARLVGPRDLFAGDRGYGGLIGSFSHVFWGQQLLIAADPATDNQTISSGGTLNPAVEVYAEHEHEDPSNTGSTVTEPHPIPGVMVTFTVTQGNGYLGASAPVTYPQTVQVLTDLTGRASVPWTPPATPGTYVLSASVPGAQPVTLTATVLAGGTGQIAVSVLDPAGAPLPGAQVNVLNTNTGTTTNASGQALLNVPLGTHQVTAQMVGYSQFTPDPATVTLSTTQPSAAITFVGTPSISVSVSPTGATLNGGQSQQFTAQVTGTTNTAVSWTVQGFYGNEVHWTVNPDGTLTVTGGSSQGQCVHGGSAVITATSQQDNTASATASVSTTCYV